MKYLGISLLGIVIAGLVAVAGYLYVQDVSFQGISSPSPEARSPVSSDSSESQDTTKPVASPTPFPFQELTIPYLRTRSYDSSLGELNQNAETETYTSYLTNYDSDGLRINGQLTIPTADQPEGGFPAVVFVHGYIPPQQYRTLEKYTTYVDYLARNGLVVFKIDLRGHGDSEGDPGSAYYGGDYVIDTLNAHAALQNADFVNPDQVGLWGHSMAGNIVFRALASQPEEVPKIVIWAGAVYSYEDFFEIGIRDPSYQPPPEDSERRREREELLATHGEYDPASPFWQMVAGTNYLDEIEGAVQIHHAVNDNVVPVDYSRNLIDILEDTDIPHELYEYPTGGHNIEGASFTEAMERTVEFLTNY